MILTYQRVQKRMQSKFLATQSINPTNYNSGENNSVS